MLFQNIKGKLPSSLQTDNGSEFINKQFQTWLKDHDIGFFTSKKFDMKATLIKKDLIDLFCLDCGNISLTPGITDI